MPSRQPCLFQFPLFDAEALFHELIVRRLSHEQDVSETQHAGTTVDSVLAGGPSFDHHDGCAEDASRRSRSRGIVCFGDPPHRRKQCTMGYLADMCDKRGYSKYIYVYIYF